MKKIWLHGLAVLLLFLFPLFLASCRDTQADAWKTLELLKAKQGVNTRDALGNTALIFAAREGHYHTAKLLMDYGADVNAQNKSGETALMAVLSGLVNPPILDEESPAFARLPQDTQDRIIILKLLIANKASVSSKDKTGRTALMKTALDNNAICAAYLIKLGAGVNDRDNAGMTPLGLLYDILNQNISADLTQQNKQYPANYNQADIAGRQNLVKQNFMEQYGSLIKILKDAGGR